MIVANMVPIGCAANGDPLVICFNEARCAIGLVSHDHFGRTLRTPRQLTLR
jgi:hypothetical protein